MNVKAMFYLDCDVVQYLFGDCPYVQIVMLVKVKCGMYYLVK